MPSPVRIRDHIRIDETLIRSLPKAEVHVHLEGSFELADLLQLAKETGTTLPGPAATLFDVATHAAPRGAEENTGLSAFLRFLDWQCGLVQTAEVAARIAYRFAARQSASGIRYTDVVVNPTHWHGWPGSVASLFEALAAGFDEAQQDGLCEVNMCLSLLRQQTAGEGREIAEWIAEARPSRVIGLSIDGDERAAGRTGTTFADAFDIAKAAGIRRTVHAGESSGPEGVWDALNLLHAERIDHGVRAIEDPALVDHLRTSAIPLGICPRSNLSLGIYPDMEHHPLEMLRAQGVVVTVNTDDPAPIGTRLENEWTLVADTWGWGLDEIRQLASNSIVASFATPETKSALLAELAAVTTS
ncbi:MAG: adenosine deaminase [Frondihabitans sp.]|nr:adenosine deaminase [Frondihabitans sp.]